MLESWFLMPNRILPVTTVGSYAWPGWYFLVMTAAERGAMGSQDLAEALSDAVEVALQDQIAAGVDILTDGEMRRVDFIVSFPKRLRGIRELPVARRLPPDGHDQRAKYSIESELTAPAGLGIVVRSDWRLGVKWIAGALVLAALVRLVIPSQQAGMLEVRRRAIDVVILAGLGVALWFLSTSIPNQPVL